jgi:hypothetical protein
MNNVVRQQLWTWKARRPVGGMVRPSRNVRWTDGGGAAAAGIGRHSKPTQRRRSALHSRGNDERPHDNDR